MTLSAIVPCLLCLIPLLPVHNSAIRIEPCGSHSVLLSLIVCVCLVRSLCDVLPVLSGCVSSCYISSLAPSSTDKLCVCVCVLMCLSHLCVNAHCSYVLFSFQSLNRAFLSSYCSPSLSFRCCRSLSLLFTFSQSHEKPD